MKMTMFMLLKTTPAWLTLSRPERRVFMAATIAPILAVHPATRMRYYDAEALTGRCTDLAVFETEDLEDYSDLVDAMRDTPFFGLPYYEIVDIVPAIENGFLAYDERLAARG
jgi:hypothetical protein